MFWNWEGPLPRASYPPSSYRMYGILGMRRIGVTFCVQLYNPGIIVFKVLQGFPWFLEYHYCCVFLGELFVPDF